jgi:hypothetical protein
MSQFAGNWDPTQFQQFFGGTSPYDIFRKKYAPSETPRFDPSTLKSNEAQEIYAILQATKSTDPRDAILQAELSDLGAQRASELSRQNIDYAVGKQREYEKQRDKERFTYGMLASIPQAITQASTAAAAMKLAAGESMQQGGRNILDAYSRMQLPSSPMYQSQKYFG